MGTPSQVVTSGPTSTIGDSRIETVTLSELGGQPACAKLAVTVYVVVAVGVAVVLFPTEVLNVAVGDQVKVTESSATAVNGTDSPKQIEVSLLRILTYIESCKLSSALSMMVCAALQE